MRTDIILGVILFVLWLKDGIRHLSQKIGKLAKWR